jgi:hypothetical protein
MKNEIEQKKEYLAPKMDIIEMDRQAELLAESSVDVFFEKKENNE